MLAETDHAATPCPTPPELLQLDLCGPATRRARVRNLDIDRIQGHRTVEVRARQIPFSRMRQDEAHRHMAPGFGGVERQCLLGAAHGLLLAAHQQVSPISTELGVHSKSVCLRVTTVELARAGKEGIGLGVLVMMKLFSPLQEINLSG